MYVRYRYLLYDRLFGQDFDRIDGAALNMFSQKNTSEAALADDFHHHEVLHASLLGEYNPANPSEHLQFNIFELNACHGQAAEVRPTGGNSDLLVFASAEVKRDGLGAIGLTGVRLVRLIDRHHFGTATLNRCQCDQQRAWCVNESQPRIV